MQIRMRTNETIYRINYCHLELLRSFHINFYSLETEKNVFQLRAVRVRSKAKNRTIIINKVIMIGITYRFLFMIFSLLSWIFSHEFSLLNVLVLENILNSIIFSKYFWNRTTQSSGRIRTLKTQTQIIWSSL